MVSFKDDNAAIGVALRLTMKYPAFSCLPFGEWAEVLAGQAKRGHQAFVVDEASEVRGFFGYAIVAEADAEAWVSGGARLTNEQCLAGDCLILNAWVSSDARVLRFMLNAFRRLGLEKKTLYFKRVYPNGTMRPSRTSNNPFVAGHLAKARAILAAQGVGLSETIGAEHAPNGSASDLVEI
jgi:hemolysin-activating ACP:hemolysin acyltransferase